MILVDVAQLAFVHRIGTKTERERIQYGVVDPIARIAAVDDLTNQFAVIFQADPGLFGHVGDQVARDHFQRQRFFSALENRQHAGVDEVTLTGVSSE